MPIQVQVHLTLGLITIVIVFTLAVLSLRQSLRSDRRRSRSGWRMMTACWFAFTLCYAAVLACLLQGWLVFSLVFMQGLGLIGAFVMAFATRLFMDGEQAYRGSQEELREARAVLAEHQENLEGIVARRTSALRAEIAERRKIQRALDELNQRHERELALAKSIQDSMFGGIPRQDYCEIAVRREAHYAVSGDVQVIEADAQQLRVLMADAMGHGLAAALLTQVVQAGVRSFPLGAPGEDIFRDLNRLLAVGQETVFCTAACLWLSPDGLMRVVSAGSPAVLVWRAASQSLEVLDGGGFPLGMFAELPAPFTAVKARLQPDDRIYLFTDGLFELKAPDGSVFGQDRLSNLLQQLSSLDPDQALDRLMAVLKDFAGDVASQDDMTVAAIRFRGERA